MSNEAQAVTPASSQEPAATKTFFESVNEATSKLTVNETSGKLEFPSGVEMTEEVKVAAFAEKKRRDAQSALAQSNNQLAIERAKNEELVKLVKGNKRVELAPDVLEELDELKFADPDAWRVRMNELEQTATTQVDTTLSDISAAAQTKGSVGEREVLLQAFIDDNPGFVINDDVIANDIPPRITKKLESGESSFTEFLQEAKDYLGAGKVIAGVKTSDDPNLTHVGGSSTPSTEAQTKDSESSYEDEIF